MHAVSDFLLTVSSTCRPITLFTEESVVHEGTGGDLAPSLGGRNKISLTKDSNDLF